jgi:hypothetical protein
MDEHRLNDIGLSDICSCHMVHQTPSDIKLSDIGIHGIVKSDMTL